MELQRYGRGPEGFPYILTALPDGYWTPWHVADQQIRRLETRVEELEAGQAVGEAEDLRRPNNRSATAVNAVGSQLERRVRPAACNRGNVCEPMTRFCPALKP